MTNKEYKRKYCNKKMHRFDYETYNGYCSKCREILDWKKRLVILRILKNNFVL